MRECNSEEVVECFIDAMDAISYRPVITEQALLELVSIHHPDAPIEGTLILKIKKGYEVLTRACPERCGFLYVFRKEKER